MPSPQRVASVYLRLTRTADLVPPLGYPGGEAHLVRRIDHANPTHESFLISKVKDGEDLTNAEAAKIYQLDVESPPANTRFRRLIFSRHAQYRMDLRGITVPEVRTALASFNKAFNDARSRGQARRWEEQILRGDPINWEDLRLGLVVVFTYQGSDVGVVTVYRRDE